VSMEAGVVVDLDGKDLYWHLPPDRTGGSLPDSQALWEFIWNNRDRITGIAHSHPGSGIPGPSHTDVTTFAAVEAGLGKRLDWWIVSEDNLIVARWEGPHKLTYKCTRLHTEPDWIRKLREYSYTLIHPEIVIHGT
jgi:proteasome lid subunit RPN8/RPN11